MICKGKMNSLLSKVCMAFLISVMGCSITNAEFLSQNEKKASKEIVVLIHGLGRSNMAMWRLASRIEEAGYHVVRVGYSSLNQTPQAILQDVTQQINDCCAVSKQPVHFVGHSLGGLMIRAYLQDNRPKNFGRVVLMGTPNQGTEVVDYYRDHWWMKLAGPMANALGTDEKSFPNTLKDPDYPVGVIAGITESPVPEEVLPGHDDGLVSVESTKVSGMSDFILVETGHSMMRYNEEVANQAIYFLKHGHFSDKK